MMWGESKVLVKTKASIRAKVKHPFRVIKRQFGHRKTRYGGLAKYINQLLVMFALSNLWMVLKRMHQGLAARAGPKHGHGHQNWP